MLVHHFPKADKKHICSLTTSGAQKTTARAPNLRFQDKSFYPAGEGGRQEKEGFLMSLSYF